MTAPLHGTSQGDPPHPLDGNHVRFTVEGVMHNGYLDVGDIDNSWSLAPRLLRHGTVEVIAPPLPPIPEEMGVVVQDPNGRLWTRWPEDWRSDDDRPISMVELLSCAGWTRADLIIVSLPVPK